ncbi:MAG: CPBP family intramembrane metalloprotease [Candidatus Pacebacteria bacterium]|jgi:membrane protease YdiL (CAAX protease family)|nr:CPBP family intramembrane metalloprotease [Candidatus Paceibacterota bacterium]MBT6921783.1 CPBP family intramembrane metalloprotease [Candidatus Paceibacterota bacterium]
MNKTNYFKLGIRIDNIKKSLLPYTILTVILSLGLIASLRLFSQSMMDVYHTFYPLFWISIPLSILQEIVFRGFGMYQLKKLFKKPIAVILLNSILFSLFHMFIPEQLLFVPLSFLAGLAFATVYYYYPNLFLVSLAHVVINLLPVFYWGLIG